MIDRVGSAHSWVTMSDRNPGTAAPTDPIVDLLSGTTQPTPTTPPPPRDPLKGGSPSNVVLRLVPQPADEQ